MAAGRTAGTRWWSVTMTSRPRSLAAATSATLVVPQSTVMMRLEPVATAASSAANDKPWPSSSRLGTYGSTATPNRRRARVMIASPVSPSASKSPKTRMRSPRSRACRTRASSRSASGSRAGSCNPSSGSPNQATRSSPVTTPRAASRFARRRGMPCAAAAEIAAADGSTVCGNVHRKRGSTTASGCHVRLHRGSTGRVRRSPQDAARRGRGVRAAMSRPCRRSSQSCQSTSSGAATKIEE